MHNVHVTIKKEFNNHLLATNREWEQFTAENTAVIFFFGNATLSLLLRYNCEIIVVENCSLFTWFSWLLCCEQLHQSLVACAGYGCFCLQLAFFLLWIFNEIEIVCCSRKNVNSSFFTCLQVIFCIEKLKENKKGL